MGGSRGNRGDLLLCLVLLMFTALPASLATDPAPGNSCGVAVCFAIDTSSSINNADPTNFNKVKSFVTQVIDGVAQLADVVQFGASTFSTQAAAVPQLSTLTSDVTLAKNAINNITYTGGATNMEGGIARCFVKNTDNTTSGVLTKGYQAGLPRIILLLTDGKPNVKDTTSPPLCSCPTYAPGVCLPSDYQGNTDTSACGASATKLRATACSSAGIKFISVGVGAGVDATFLQGLGDYVAVSNFGALKDIVDQVVSNVCSDVGVTKTVMGSPVTVGDKVTFTINVVNTGKFAVKNVTFKDTVPAGLVIPNPTLVTPGSNSTPTATCSVSGQILTCNINGDVPTGSGYAYMFDATATVAGNVTNVVDITAAQDNNPNNNEGKCDVVIVNKQPPPVINSTDLIITKTVADDSIILGTNAVFTITVQNNAKIDANNSVITDTLPPGLKFVSSTGATCTPTSNGNEFSCPIGTIPAGGSKSITITAAPLAANPGYINSAIVTADAGPAGGTVTSGPATATVKVDATCNKATTTVGTDGTVTVQAYDCGAGYNFNGANGDSTPPTQATCCTAKLPSVSINKTITPSEVLIGSTVTITITVTNSGDGIADLLTVVDNLPPCLQLIGIVTPGPGNNNGECSLPQAVSNCTSEFVPVAAARGVTTQSVRLSTELPACTPVPGSEVQCGPGSLDPGTTKTYTITAKAISAGVCANTATVNFTNPVTNTTQTIPGTGTVNVTRTCAVYDKDGKPFSCDEGSVLSPANANNTEPDQGTCCVAGGQGTPSLNITKVVDGPSSVLIGATVYFNVTVTNSGDANATNVTITDTLGDGLVVGASLPAGCTAAGAVITCGPFDLAAGASKVYRISAVATVVGTLNNTATASLPGPGPTTPPATVTVTVTQTCKVYTATGDKFNCSAGTSYNSSQDDNTSPSQETCCSTGGGGVPGLTITKVVKGGATEILIGTTFSYEVTVTNTDTTAATGVTVEDKLQGGLKFATPLPTGCTANGQKLTCGPLDIAAGASTTITIKVLARAVGRRRNTATITTPVITPTPTDTVTVTVYKTCASFNNKGEQFKCPTGQTFDQSQADNREPNAQNCCTSNTNTGACCKPDGSCTVGTKKQCKAGGTFNPGKTCEEANCQSNSYLGACCKSGSCTDGVLSTTCKDNGGQPFNSTCAENSDKRICGRPNAPTGTCCVGTDQCSVTTKKDCASKGGIFKKGGTCNANTCSSPGPGACIPAWLPCIPPSVSSSNDTCCEGSSCQVAIVYNNKAYYACKPNQPACLPEGGRCGDCYGGGVCCSGLTCKWNYYAGYGTCQKPYTCGKYAQLCSGDGDCCPGLVCGAYGKCTTCSCNITCARSSFKNKGCSITQKNDCKSLSAAAAGKQPK